MLGSGVIHENVMNKGNRKENEYGWACGIGLERFAMLLFEIPDIRIFWSKNEDFLNQYKDGKIRKFESFSKYPSCYKDISFWINDGEIFEENDFYEVLRNVAGDLIEKVEMIDYFQDKKRNKVSRCFRIFFRSLERTLLNDEVLL